MSEVSCGSLVLGAERREQDRRRATVRSLLVGGIYRSRRRGPRREADRHNHYVDWYEPKLFAVTLGIFVLNCLDAVFTLTLLSKGAEEINVFMAVLLENGVETFVHVKLAITAVALIFLVVHSAFRLIGTVRVRHLLYGIFGNYLALFFYELSLLARVM